MRVWTYISYDVDERMCYCIRQDVGCSFIEARGDGVNTIPITEETHVPQQVHRHLRVLQ